MGLSRTYVKANFGRVSLELIRAVVIYSFDRSRTKIFRNSLSTFFPLFRLLVSIIIELDILLHRLSFLLLTSLRSTASQDQFTDRNRIGSRLRWTDDSHSHLARIPLPCMDSFRCLEETSGEETEDSRRKRKTESGMKTQVARFSFSRSSQEQTRLSARKCRYFIAFFFLFFSIVSPFLSFSFEYFLLSSRDSFRPFSALPWPDISDPSS